MLLQDELDAYRTTFEAKAPAEALKVMHRSTEDLIASGQADRALKAGQEAPTFVLPDPEGEPVASHDLLARGPLVVTFYRGAWCPYCNLDLKALEAARPAMEACGASLVAISQQTAANSRKSQRDNRLGFPILADHGGAIAAAFGLRWTLPADLKAIYAKFGVDLPSFNGEDSWTLPMPARYVIARDGTIGYAEVNPDYTRRPDPSELLPVLDSLRQ